jgi:hypothetical protein
LFIKTTFLSRARELATVLTHLVRSAKLRAFDLTTLL